MFYLNKFNKYIRLYIFFLGSILFLNLILTSNSYGNTFKIINIEVSEEFDLNFKKEKIYEKAFRKAFEELISKITISENKKRLKNVNIFDVKRLIDSFNIGEEEFMHNKYFAKFNVNFNRKKVIFFLENQNIYTSSPQKVDVLFIPILIRGKKEELIIFENNPFYKNWNEDSEKDSLINYVLPIEDIEDRKILMSNIDMLEEYDFREFLNKYNLENYITQIIYFENNNLRILTKINLKNDKSTISKNYKDIQIDDQVFLNRFINELKINYEDKWKKLNVINTSIKLPINLSLSSSSYKKIKLFEKTLDGFDFVYEFNIDYFDNENIFYNIVYNGSPKNFLTQMDDRGLVVEKQNEIWSIK